MNLARYPLTVVLMLAPAVAGARAERGLATGRSYMVRVRAHHGVGLANGIPDDSDYAQAIAADAAGNYMRAAKLYARAARAFRLQKASRPDDERIAGWIRKAQEQRGLSRQLNILRTNSRRIHLYRHMYFSRSGLAIALHRKWLAIRAFTGRGPKRLLKEAEDAYRAVLRLKPSNDVSRIYLAALYYELGDWRRGRELFTQVHAKARRGYQIPLAYYYAVIGDHRRALEILRRAALHSSYRYKWQAIAGYNFFDRLRADPEFAELTKK